MKTPRLVTSVHNPLLQRVRRLSREALAYRKLDQVWVEGEHLCSALVSHGREPATAIVSESAWRQRPRLGCCQRRAC